MPEVGKDNPIFKKDISPKSPKSRESPKEEVQRLDEPSDFPDFLDLGLP